MPTNNPMNVQDVVLGVRELTIDGLEGPAMGKTYPHESGGTVYEFTYSNRKYVGYENHASNNATYGRWIIYGTIDRYPFDFNARIARYVEQFNQFCDEVAEDDQQ